MILDEAHLYCPERGSGEAESTEAVVSLMSQGRKRGYAGIIATQRLSKLHKDAAAEANNVIIGRTWLDADQAEAGDALGLSKSDRLKLRDLRQGEFYAFGPALNHTGVARFHSDPVKRTHPRPGERHLLTAPAPSRAIRGIIGKFADLPQEAEDEIRGLDQARRRIANLERQIKSVKLSQMAAPVDRAVIDRAVDAAVKRERSASKHKMDQAGACFRQALATVGSAAESLGKVKALLEDVDRAWLGEPIVAVEPEAASNGRHDETAILASLRRSVIVSSEPPSKLASGERRILTALAQYAADRSKVQVAVLTGYAVGGGGFNNYLGALRSRELIEGDGERLRITEAGIQALDSWERLPAGSELIDYWRRRLGKGGAVDYRSAHPGVSRRAEQGGSCCQSWL